MQALFQSHQEAHDTSIGSIDSVMERIEKNLDRLSAAQLITEQKLQNLIDILAHEHVDGRVTP